MYTWLFQNASQVTLALIVSINAGIQITESTANCSVFVKNSSATLQQDVKIFQVTLYDHHFLHKSFNDINVIIALISDVEI